MTGGQSQDGAVSAVRREARVAIEEIDSDPDLPRAFQRASELTEESQILSTEAGLLRARIAERLMVSEALSLQSLADRLGLSKSRADQLVRTARSARSNAS